MTTYTVICVDTTGWKTWQLPTLDSVRVYAIETDVISGAAGIAQDCMERELEPDEIQGWTIVAVLEGEHQAYNWSHDKIRMRLRPAKGKP